MAAAGILYLDVDDEITSAAGRIRRAEGSRVAVVLPYGSKVATSRINFRLLARDALTHEKRLSIVAPDGATRALAASAGLPVFATVAEYESSLEEPARAEPGAGWSGADTVVIAPADPAADPAADAGAEADEDHGSESGGDDDPPTDRAVASGSAAAAAAGDIGPPTSRPAATTPIPRPAASPTASPAVPRPRPEPATMSAATSIPVIGSGRRSIPRVPLLIGAAVIGLAVLVSAVGAYVLLPSATIVVTPREQLVGPRSFSVIADTSVTQPDPDAGIVPADVLTLEVTTMDTFAATGTRAEETRAEGRVTFTSFDTSGTNTIPAGSVIATEGGVRFRTLGAITLARAEIVPPTSVSPTSASVAVEAVAAGPEGNVPANAIVLVPANEDPVITKVRNTQATSGGSRTEFPVIVQQDVDGALAALQEALQASFEDQLFDPSIGPPGSTVFTDTAALGVPAQSVDTAELVDAEQETFELGLTATGTVLAVDPAPVQDIARTRLAALVTPGSELVEGSVVIDTGEAVVEGQTVSFPVTVRATQVSIPDAAELEALVLGKPRAEAEALLATYGDVELVLWPDWVTSVPTLDGRVTVEVATPIPAELPPSTPTPSPSPRTESASPAISSSPSASP